MMVGPAPAGAPVPAGTPRPPAKGPGACAPRQVQPRRGYLPRPAPFKMAAQLGPTIIQGAKLGRIRLAARQTSLSGLQARQAKEGGPSPRGGPPDAAGTDKMQGRPRPKGIKAGPCILPLHFGRGCGMALPPPRPADRPRDDR